MILFMPRYVISIFKIDAVNFKLSRQNNSLIKNIEHIGAAKENLVPCAHKQQQILACLSGHREAATTNKTNVRLKLRTICRNKCSENINNTNLTSVKIATIILFKHILISSS